jgi:phosphohistidine phosphatase
MATLVLLRHAKAQPHGPDDLHRELVPQGRADAAAARSWLAAQQIAPDRVVVSPATRARQTWELAAVGEGEVVLDQRLYANTVDDLVQVLREASAGVLVLVGHNPGLERLAWELDDSPEARELTDRGLPTCAVAVFDVPEWGSTDGRLVALGVPRG